MVSEVKKFWRREAEKWKLGAQGAVLAAREGRFWLVFVPAFLLFGTLLNLLASGTAGFSLLFSSGAEGFFRILGKAFLALFGIGRFIGDFLLIFIMAMLQATLIATIVVVAKHHRDDKVVTAEESEQTKTSVQNSGLVAGLAILGSGCPSCGTALITPVLGSLFSTGSIALAGVVSGIITVVAMIVAIFSLRSAGIDAYAGILKVCPRVIMKKEKKNGKNR